SIYWRPYCLARSYHPAVSARCHAAWLKLCRRGKVIGLSTSPLKTVTRADRKSTRTALKLPTNEASRSLYDLRRSGRHAEPPLGGNKPHCLSHFGGGFAATFARKTAKFPRERLAIALRRLTVSRHVSNFLSDGRHCCPTLQAPFV